MNKRSKNSTINLKDWKKLELPDLKVNIKISVQEAPTDLLSNTNIQTRTPGSVKGWTKEKTPENRNL